MAPPFRKMDHRKANLRRARERRPLHPFEHFTFITRLFTRLPIIDPTENVYRALSKRGIDRTNFPDE